MPSADSCPLTDRVTPASAAFGTHILLGLASLVSLAAGRRPARAAPGVGEPVPHRRCPEKGPSPADRNVGQVSPDKNVDLRCTTASFTTPLEPLGFVMLCPLAPEARPSMTFLFVGSQLCTRASSRPLLAETPLPSASGCRLLLRRRGFSRRGLAPHKSTPMPGVHNRFNSDGSESFGNSE